jgi:Transposase IS116/IS110/IS902 family.
VTNEIEMLAFADQVVKFTRQLKKDATNLTKRDLRYLVDTYDQIQRYRIRAGQQVKAAKSAKEEPNPIIEWMHENFQKFEYYVKRVLDAYTDADPVGRWAKSITGIGPVIAANLLAYIDITKAPTVGHIWRYCGLDPTIQWGPGQLRPYNTKMKTICYHIGQGFVRNRKTIKQHI